MGILPRRSARFEAFVAPARTEPALWRLVAGTGLAAALWIGAVAGLLPLADLLPRAGGRVVLLLYLLSFAALALGTGLAARLLQRRRPARLLGPGGFRPGHFGLGAATVLVVGSVSALPLLALAPPTRQMDVAAWAVWLPLAVPALFVQTAAEELAFRGYLMQGLAARFRSRAVWWLLPAALFGLLHWNPGEFGRDSWLVALSAAVLGLILADVTIRTGNLSAAMGLHFANNALAVLVLAMPSPLARFSLYLAEPRPPVPATTHLLLLADLAVTLLAYAAWLAFCARRRRLHSGRGGSI